jgi:hypothetical protein
MIARRIGIAASLAALAACSQASQPIDMANPPRTKAGLWVMTGSLHGQARAPFTFCDTGTAILPPKDPSCSQWQALRTADGAIEFNAVCTDSGATIRLHRRIVGDLASSFTDDVTSTMEAQGQPKSTLTSHAVLRFQGPCAPGMKPFNRIGG